MPLNLPLSGRISYNGYNFGPKTETVSLKMTTVEDSARRSIKYIVFSITLRTQIQTLDNGATTTDAEMLNNIRRKLLVNGGEFHYENRGMGGLTINVPGNAGPKDVIWGPKPKEIDWRPTGGAFANEMTWTVEVAIPDCPDAVFANFLMEFCYTLSFKIDRSGYTTREYRGHVIIPQTRSTPDSRRLTDSVDRYREAINPPVVSGFRRIPGDFVISEDKCRLDFTIVDEQMVRPPPPGVTEVEGNYSIQSMNSGLWRWLGTLTVTYDVARGYHPYLALNHFYATLFDRASQAAMNGLDDKDNKTDNVVFTSVRFEEPQLWGKTNASFSASFTYAANRASFLQASGLWRVIPDQDFDLWATSMSRILGSRGFAGMQFLTGDDLIVDLCRPSRPTIFRATVREPVLLKKIGEPVFQNKLPAEDSSWLMYRMRVVIEEQSGTIEHKPLPSKQVLTANIPITETSLQTIPSDSPLFGAEVDKLLRTFKTTTTPFEVTVDAGANSESIIQQRAWPTYKISLVGSAVRAGYYIDAPQVVQAMGRKCVKANREGHEFFATGVLANWFELPIVGASWRQRWIVTDIPNKGLGVPANPIMGIGA